MDVFCAFSVMFLFIGFQDFINVIIIIGSLLCGLVVSLFYNGVFNYINECGKRDKRTKMYFGLCICINQSATLIGNGLSAVLIQPFGQKLYSVFMLGLGVLSSMSMIFVKDFEPIINEKKTLIDKPNAAIQ